MPLMKMFPQNNKAQKNMQRLMKVVGLDSLVIPACLGLELGKRFQHCGLVADFRKDMANKHSCVKNMPDEALVRLVAVSAYCLAVVPARCHVVVGLAASQSNSEIPRY